MSQTPAAGTKVAKSSAVNLVVSSGPATDTVPDVIGLTQSNAASAITEAGLTVGTVTSMSSAIIPAGKVISQSPSVGTQVLGPSPGRYHRFLGGRRHAGAESRRSDQQPQAASALFPASLLLGTVKLQASSTVPTGRVVSQNPAAGASAVQGDSVNVTISTGPSVSGGTAPVVTIISPVDNTAVTNFTQVKATISAGHLALYQVHMAKASDVDLTTLTADNPKYTLIAQGTVAVTNGTVASFDPTTLDNDSYVIRIRAYDAAGLVTAQAVTVGVSANLKLGRFTLDTTDLSVPLVGIPIQIVRHYDSFRSNTSGDFGYGWSLGARDAQISATLKPGPIFGPTLAPGSRVYPHQA